MTRDPHEADANAGKPSGIDASGDSSSTVQPFSSSENAIALGSTLPPPAGMTIGEHLAELRHRLIVSIGALLTGITGAFFFALPVIDAFKAMAQHSEITGAVEFVQLTPGEVLLCSAKLSVYLGAVVASPVVLFQVLQFILPGLQPKERRNVLWILLGGMMLFCAGVVFAYFLVIPSALTYLLEYGQAVAKTQISIASYVDFCSSILVLTGILFELPLVLFFLALTGLINSRQLIAQWRMAIVIIAIAGAVITPSQDAFTMIMVVVAMAGLYFLSIIPIRLSGR